MTAAGSPRSPDGLHPVRGAAFAATVVAVSLAGHRLGGGADPGPVPVVLLLAVTVAGAAMVGRRPRGAAATAGLLGLGQVAFHVVATAAAGGAGAAGHHHGPAPDVAALAVGSSGTALVTWQMVAGHAAATLVLAAVLARADAVAARALDLLHLLLPALAAAAALVVVDAGARVVPAGRVVPALAPATGSLDRRGPPRA